MYALSGFIEISAMISNEPAVTSVLGELSKRSQTFSREVGNYRNASFPDVELSSFNSNRDDVLVEVDPTYVDICLQVSQWLFQRSIDGSLSDDRENTRQLLLTEFSGILDIQRVGNMVTNGTYWLPEQLVFSKLGGTEENVIRLWYSDPSFQAQYDQYEILVVPIVDPLDDLHGARATVMNILNAITVPIVLQKIDTLVGEHPPTEIVSTEYDWTDKNDPTVTKATPWTVIIYGAAGNNADLIREALINWILGNSAQIREEWEKIYPDLFLPNEFYITPIWDKYSIPNQMASTGLYSPTMKYADMMSYAYSTFHDVPLIHIREHLTHSVGIYKSLGFVAVGNPRNRDGVYSFDQLWPQYVTIGSDRADFNKLPPMTAEFIMLLTQMFQVAESLTEFGSIPPGMSRVIRGDVQYLAATYEKMLYLVSLKSNPIFAVDPVDPENPGPTITYRIVVTTSPDGLTGVVASVYQVSTDSEGVETLTLIDAGTSVRWEAVWYGAADEVLLSNILPSSTSEELIFDQQWDAATPGRIEVTAEFNGISVYENHILTPV